MEDKTEYNILPNFYRYTFEQHIFVPQLLKKIRLHKEKIRRKNFLTRKLAKIQIIQYFEKDIH